jgi:mitogen-activated protein kinase kinase kinase
MPPNVAIGAWVTKHRYGADDDPDRHYFDRGLGRLEEGDSDSGDDEDDEYYVPLDIDDDAGYGAHAENGTHIDGSVEVSRASDSDLSPVPAYDVRKRIDPAVTTDGHTADFSDGESVESLGPESIERLEWQHMLGNVLQGDVFRSEKTRISRAAQLDDTTSKRKYRAYQIWLRVRAYVRGRDFEQEQKYIEEARTQVDSVTDEIHKFRIREGSTMQEASQQVAALLQRVEWVESLYPSIRALHAEKTHTADANLALRLDALQSWQTITRRLRMQIGILQRWTGNDALEVTQPGFESLSDPYDVNASVNSGDHRQILDTSTFVERMLKEDALVGTFAKRTISDIHPLVHAAKHTLIANRELFAAMNLPTFINDFITLVNFPTSLMQEALRLRLDYVDAIPSTDPAAVLIDQITDGFRDSLDLACRMKKEYLEIVTTDPQSGWELPAELTGTQKYDETLRKALRAFFTLLHWKLKSGSKTIYLKETEIVENEWKFLSEAVGQIGDGDLLVCEHIACASSSLLVAYKQHTDQLEQHAHPSSYAAGGQLFRRTARGPAETEHDIVRDVSLV